MKVLRSPYMFLMLCMCSAYVHANTITQTDIDGGITITQSGTYTLAESVTFTTSVAITIAHDDVQLDLNGYTIDGLLEGGTAITVTGFENTCIKNGTIKNNTSNAIVVSNSPYTTVADITIENSQGDAVSVVSSLGSFVHDCVVSQGQQKAFVIIDSAQCICKACKVYTCLGGGIEITGASTGSVCDTCIVRDCTGTGYTIVTDAAELASCVSHMNKGELGHGFVLQGANCIIRNAAACKNEGHGLVIDGDTVTVNTVTVSENGGHGVELEATSTRVALTLAICVSNAGSGVKNFGATSNSSYLGIARNNGETNWWHIQNKDA